MNSHRKFHIQQNRIGNKKVKPGGDPSGFTVIVSVKT